MIITRMQTLNLEMTLGRLANLFVRRDVSMIRSMRVIQSVKLLRKMLYETAVPATHQRFEKCDHGHNQ